MASNIEIKYIQKTAHSDPYERVRSIGGIKTNGCTWRLSFDAAISSIETGKWSFWVTHNGKPIPVIISTHNGHKYLKADGDSIEPTMLLALPEFPTL